MDISVPFLKITYREFFMERDELTKGVFLYVISQNQRQMAHNYNWEYDQ